MNKSVIVIGFLAACFGCATVNSVVANTRDGVDNVGNTFLPVKSRLGLSLLARSGCPLCDSSVYSYCYEKVFHDTCCCDQGFGRNELARNGGQCQFQDCSFIHANTCYEHRLITSCCCNNPYR